MDEMKATLLRYLQAHRDAVLWKLEGIPERDQRMPMTTSGTNLLGLVKHLAGLEVEYFGTCLGRPAPGLPPWPEGTEPNTDMFAAADQSPALIADTYRRAWARADEAIAELPLDAPATVPWWGPAAETTLHRLLVHMIAETARHAGHMDILRETIDGARGHRPGVLNLPDVDPDWWPTHVAHLRTLAEST